VFLLHTDHLQVIQRQKEPEFGRLAGRMSKHAPSAFYVSILSFQEQTAGCHAYADGAKTSEDMIRACRMFRSVLADFAAMQVLTFDEPAAEIFGSLRRQHVEIATVDLQMASIALSHRLRLLSQNLGEFFKVPRLTVEDWTVA